LFGEPLSARKCGVVRRDRTERWQRLVLEKKLIRALIGWNRNSHHAASAADRGVISAA